LLQILEVPFWRLVFSHRHAFPKSEGQSVQTVLSRGIFSPNFMGLLSIEQRMDETSSTIFT
jgi:hypothetical protein